MTLFEKYLKKYKKKNMNINKKAIYIYKRSRKIDLKLLKLNNILRVYNGKKFVLCRIEKKKYFLKKKIGSFVYTRKIPNHVRKKIRTKGIRRKKKKKIKLKKEYIKGNYSYGNNF